MDPLYEEVVKGNTPYCEVIHLRFDNSVISYEQLIRFFFTFHDPTTALRQGSDRGSHYQSSIFCHSESQTQIAEEIMDEL